MKTIKTIGAGLFIALSFMLTSCEPEPVDIPDQDSRDNFVGSWTADDSPAKSTLNTYVVTISKDPNNSSQVLMNNFHQTNQSVAGLVTSGRITVTNEVTNAGSISGEGKLVGNTIQWTYSVNDGADLVNYVATYTK